MEGSGVDGRGGVAICWPAATSAEDAKTMSSTATKRMIRLIPVYRWIADQGGTSPGRTFQSLRFVFPCFRGLCYGPRTSRRLCHLPRNCY